MGPYKVGIHMNDAFKADALTEILTQLVSRAVREFFATKSPIKCVETPTRLKIYNYLDGQAQYVKLAEIVKGTKVDYVRVKNDLRALRRSGDVVMYGNRSTALYRVARTFGEV